MQISIIIGIILSLIGGEMAAVGELDNYELLSGSIATASERLMLGVIVVLSYGIGIFVYNHIKVRKLAVGRFSGSPSKIVSGERIGAVVLAGVVSFGLSWGKLAAYLPDIYLLHELLWMLPFISMVLIQLYFCYELDIAARVGFGGTDYKPWSLVEYMVYHIRHNLLSVVVPLGLISLLGELGEDIVVWVGSRFGVNVMFMIDYELVTLVAVVITFSLAPLLLRYIWTTQPLEAGELRSKLSEFGDEVKLSYSEILSWHTYRMVGNAAVTGLFPPLRYVIISDRLLTDLSVDQLCAVFGHEAGHIRHKHMQLMLAAMMALMIDLGWLVDWLLGLVPASWPLWVSDVLGIALMAAAVVGGYLLFGVVSRNFERQADVFAAEAVGAEDSANDGKLSSIGSAIMSSALNRLSFINGMSVSKSSFRHGSLSDRMGLLYELAVTPGALKRFELKLKLIKVGILAGFAVAVWLSLGE